tara:strand:- start:154 stop:342 length:189 start_codon:yes stop_codon:yes gene_type:complete
MIIKHRLNKDSELEIKIKITMEDVLARYTQIHGVYFDRIKDDANFQIHKILNENIKKIKNNK